MNFWTLAARSLVFYARAHLGAVVGTAVGGAALTGALMVGDSMRGSLLENSLEGLGRFQYALTAGDRFFTTDLARSLEASQELHSKVQVSALLLLNGVARNETGSARANHVQVIGMDDGFLKNIAGDSKSPGQGGALINESLAKQIGVKPGDEVLLRVPKASALSQEVTLTERNRTEASLRLKVAAVVPSKQGGDFRLNRSQLPPMNLFLDRAALERALGKENRCNALAVAPAGNSGDIELPPGTLETALRNTWTLEDAALELRQTTNIAGVELRTSRVFLDPVVTDAAAKAVGPSTRLLAYLANLIQRGTNSTPYSFVCAAGSPYVPATMKDDEIVLNQWIAEDLGAKPGDRIDLAYFDPGSGARLLEVTNTFKVHSIVPMSAPWRDQSLLPEFPGIERAESTGDWEVGFELVHKIRPKDEAYWKQLRGTPKAFITEAAGQKLWANRFGNFTALRWMGNDGTSPETKDIGTKLRNALDPGQFGLVFQPVRQMAIRAASDSQDFGQLFIGFSFFLIAAALVLVAMLFRFGLDQRSAEAGTFAAMGFSPRQIRKLFLVEAAGLALLGSALGVLGGAVYAKAMLWGLATVWRGATGAPALRFHLNLSSVAIGLCAATLLAVLVVWLVLRKWSKAPALELLGMERDQNLDSRKSKGRWFAVFGIVGGGAALAWALYKRDLANAGAFFGAGSLLLIGGLGVVATWLASIQKRNSSRLSLQSLGFRGSSRQVGRSLTTVALLACGVFMISAVSAFRLDARRDSAARSSGTGGFALYAESTMPIVQDLNTKAGREFFGLSDSQLQNVRVLPMRVRLGDDASCLNLNRAQNPRVLGIAADEMKGRFTVVSVAQGLDPKLGWGLLKTAAANPDIIPAFGDANSIQWALGKKVGDTLDYTDDRGRHFKIRLVGAIANSILQGSLIIDEAAFLARFPSETGYKILLIDTPSGAASQVSASLTRALEDSGLEVTVAADRLNAFNAVQNTYLGAFQVLGALGLLLGSAGLGIVVLRNVMERRGELGLLSAVGFRKRTLTRVLLFEHGWLLTLGILVGIGAAFAAVLPSVLSPNSQLPWVTLAITVGAVVVNGLLWTLIATRVSLRGNLLAALRNE